MMMAIMLEWRFKLEKNIQKIEYNYLYSQSNMLFEVSHFYQIQFLPTSKLHVYGRYHVYRIL